MSDDDIFWFTERLAEMGFSKPNMFDYLKDCQDLPMVPYHQRKLIGDDQVSWSVGVGRNDTHGRFEVRFFNTLLIKTHPIHHQVFRGIDTAALEKQMKSVDWDSFIPPPVSSETPAESTIEQLSKLMALGGAAKDIAQRLQVRYWNNTPMERTVAIARIIPLYQSEFLHTLKGDLTDFKAMETYHLLCGRGVLKFQEIPPGSYKYHGEWKQLVGGKLQTFPNYDLVEQLKKLDLPENGPQLIYDLLRGDQRPVHWPSAGNELVYISADPKARAIKILDRHLFQWRQETSATAVKKQQRLPSGNKIRSPKRRPGGRGLSH